MRLLIPAFAFTCALLSAEARVRGPLQIADLRFAGRIESIGNRKLKTENPMTPAALAAAATLEPRL